MTGADEIGQKLIEAAYREINGHASETETDQIIQRHTNTGQSVEGRNAAFEELKDGIRDHDPAVINQAVTALIGQAKTITNHKPSEKTG